MKKKFCILTVLILCISFMRLNVSAATSAIPGDSTVEKEHYNELKAKYDAGFKKTTVTDSGLVTIYGKSVCSNGSCKDYYYGNETDFEVALSKSVTCSNGEKNIVYGDVSSGKQNFDIEGTAYWSEDYPVTCSSSSSEDSSVSIGGGASTGGTSTGGTSTGGTSTGGTSTGGTSTGGTSTGGTSTGGTSTGGTSAGGSYDSSTTVDSSETGVNTYFIVLGAVAVISYGLMILVKKYNLFKNI